MELIEAGTFTKDIALAVHTEFSFYFFIVCTKNLL